MVAGGSPYGGFAIHKTKLMLFSCSEDIAHENEKYEDFCYKSVTYNVCFDSIT